MYPLADLGRGAVVVGAFLGEPAGLSTRFAVGLRKWDLVIAAMYYDSCGWHAEEEYRELTDVNGFRRDGLGVIRFYATVRWEHDHPTTDFSGARVPPPGDESELGITAYR